MIRKQPKPLQTLHKHTQLQAFIYNSYHVLTFKRHANIKAVLLEIASHADKSKDWTCYRSQKALAKSLYGSISDSGLRTVRRCISKLKDWGYIEVVGREVRSGQGDGGACMGLNVYRVTDKLLRAVGLQRQSRQKPLVKLQDLWRSTMLVVHTSLLRYEKLGRIFLSAQPVLFLYHRIDFATRNETTLLTQVLEVKFLLLLHEHPSITPLFITPSVITKSFWVEIRAC